MTEEKCAGCNKKIDPHNHVKVDGKIFHDGKCISKYMQRPGGKRIT
jgi:hypothetical protein